MKRRNFIKGITAASLVSTLPINSFGFSQTKVENPVIKPKRLREGDTLGLVAPGSFIDEDELQESIENLEKLGFKVKPGKNILKKNGYLGGTDQERADDLNEMFRDNEVKGIIAARGGYGCMRILPLLNYDMIKSNPKILVGYSDITALIYAIFSQTGLVTFHGPVGISTFNDYSVRHFMNVLVEGESNYKMYSLDEDDEGSEFRRYAIRTGTAEGLLVGGNLSIVAALLGSPYHVPTKDKILFLEEVRESPYRIDRMLTEMLLAGHLKDCAGVALGIFKRCDIDPDDRSFSSSFSLSEVLMDRLYDLNIPVIYGLSFGHITNKFTLPVGIKAQLNVKDQSLTLLESAVI